MTALLALTGASFVFTGGDLGDLARVTAAYLHRPVVALVQSEHPRPIANSPRPEVVEPYRKMGVTVQTVPPPVASQVRKFEIGGDLAEDPKAFRRLMKVKAQTSVFLTPEAIALWNPAWQGETTHPTPLSDHAPDGYRAAKPSAYEIVDSKAIFNLAKGEAVRVSELAALDWPRPIHLHWLPETMWVVPVGKNVEESQFVTALAAAVGGRLTSSADGYRIDLDPAAFRTRALARLEANAPSSKASDLTRAHYEIARAVWTSIGDDQIQDLYRKPFVGIAFEAKPGSPEAIALSRYILAYRSKAEDARTTSADDRAGMRGMLDRIDWTGRPNVLVSQNLGVGGGWPAVGGGTVIP